MSKLKWYWLCLKIIPNGAVARDGRLCLGQRILEVSKPNWLILKAGTHYRWSRPVFTVFVFDTREHELRFSVLRAVEFTIFQWPLLHDLDLWPMTLRINHFFPRCPVWGRAPSPFPLSIYFVIFCFFYFSLSFIGFTYFLLLSIATEVFLAPRKSFDILALYKSDYYYYYYYSLFTRIVPLRFQAGGRRKRPNLGLVCFVWYLYSLV